MGESLVWGTVQLGEPDNVAATEVVARIFVVAVGDQAGKLAVRTYFAAETVDLAGDSIRNLGEVTAVVMDVAMGG